MGGYLATMAATGSTTTLIVAALLAEARPLIRRLRLRSVRDASPWRFAAERGDQRIELLVTGVGADRARRFVDQRLDEGPVAGVWAIGVAGGLTLQLRPGDLVEPAEVLDQRSGAGYTPTLPAHPVGRLLTCPRMIADPVEKRRLHREYRADAADMETAAIAAACDRRGVPWGALRAVSDPADAALPAFVMDLARPDGRSKPAAALSAVLRRPGRLADLCRLARASRKAAAALADGIAQRL